jgi:predicted DNA-binding transcriptional regulator AlpA
MSAKLFYNLLEAAKWIGISRPTLYLYLKQFPPQKIGGHPVLTHEQVKAIKAERRKINGKSNNGKK